MVMSFFRVVDRVRTDFTEMPAMEPTLPQAVRLWHLGADACRYVLDSLVDAGFLTWTRSGPSGEPAASSRCRRCKPS